MPPRPRIPAPALPAHANGGGAGGDGREIEWQLAAPDLGAVQRWLEQHTVLDDLSIEPLPLQQLEDTYLDTPDWRIFRAGFALRLRQKDGRIEATLKGLHSARADAADRREISEALSAAGPGALAHADGPVGSRVRQVAGVKPLRALFHVRTSRQRFAVRKRRRAGGVVGEVALDEARFPRVDGHRHPVVLTRVELEAVGSDPAPVEHVAERLRSGCDLKPARENKFVVGLRSASLEPPRLQDPARKAQAVQPAIEASTRASDFAAAALRHLLEQWRLHEPATRLGESAEALHALRVTARRMDILLRLFDRYLPPGVGASRPRLKALLDALGDVRDLDIRLQTLREFQDSLAEGERGALDPLLGHVDDERGQARATLLRALDAKPAREWLETLPDRLAHRAAPRAAAARQAPALTVVPDLLERRYRKLCKCARRLTPESSLRQHHKVRIRAKKLRYALELVAPTYGKAAQETLAALHKLQNKLGAQHDAGVLAEYLSHLAARPPAGFGPQTLFVMGRMAQMQRQDAGRLGGKFGKSWRKVRRRHWPALASRMRALRKDAADTTASAAAH